ncbi:MAG: YkvA family protein [Leptolyngbyaceae cyanobacterium bins.59]|nr:YkvA family protein [Leptolyngbyaceae cyanobacterium bins.59]
MNFSIQAVYNWYRSIIRNPKYRWWVIAGTILYLISPFDIAPDFLPIIGQVDDVVLLTLLVTEISSLLADRLRARKGDETPIATADASPSQNSTVDVDAVSVK